MTEDLQTKILKQVQDDIHWRHCGLDPQSQSRVQLKKSPLLPLLVCSRLTGLRARLSALTLRPQLASRFTKGGNLVAFTLAEVLVTLGIIGIVAAMTMPMLANKYQQKVTAERVKQAYSLMYQAIRMSENDHESSKYWNIRMHPNGGLENTEAWLNHFIMPYFKEPHLCGTGLTDEINKKCGHSVSGYGYTYRLQNGTIMSFVPASSFDGYENWDNPYILAVTIDVNGVNAPNRLGTDYFFFILKTDQGLIPVGYGLSRDELINGGRYSLTGNDNIYECKYDKTDPNNTEELIRHGCTALLMMDGWEFKDDYAY